MLLYSITRLVLRFMHKEYNVRLERHWCNFENFLLLIQCTHSRVYYSRKKKSSPLGPRLVVILFWATIARGRGHPNLTHAHIDPPCIAWIFYLAILSPSISSLSARILSDSRAEQSPARAIIAVVVVVVVCAGRSWSTIHAVNLVGRGVVVN